MVDEVAAALENENARDGRGGWIWGKLWSHEREWGTFPNCHALPFRDRALDFSVKWAGLLLAAGEPNLQCMEGAANAQSLAHDGVSPMGVSFPHTTMRTRGNVVRL